MSLFRRFRYQQFIDWCRSNISAQDYTTINLNAYLNELKNKNVADVINNVINNRLNEGEKLSVHIKVDTTARSDVTEYKLFRKARDKPPSLFNLDIQKIPNKNIPVKLNGLQIRHCTVFGNHVGSVVIENCEISTLSLGNEATVVIRDTKIGTLDISKAHQIDMIGGCVLNIQIAAAGFPNPLTGSIDFKKYVFPKNSA